MNTKKVNEFFGNAFIAIGMLKSIYTFLILLKMSTIIIQTSSNNEYYKTFSLILGGAQLILAIASIVMIIINTKRQPEVITGYFISLGAIALEIFTPSIIVVLFIATQCGLYIKAGKKIKSSNEKSTCDRDYKTTKKMVKNTNWFYSDENKELDVKEKNKIEKIEKVISEWKELLDAGEIDEETYNEETNKLIEKERKISKKNLTKM